MYKLSILTACEARTLNFPVYNISVLATLVASVVATLGASVVATLAASIVTTLDFWRLKMVKITILNMLLN